MAGRRRGRRRTPGVACAGRTHAGVRPALGGRPVYERRAVAVRGLASVDTAEPTPPHAPFVVVFTAAVRKLVRRRVSSVRVRVRVRVRVGLGRVSSIPCAALVTKWHSYGVDSAESQS